MYFNEMELKIYYEMKKEEFEKVIFATKFSTSGQKPSLYKNFLKLVKENKNQKEYTVSKLNCCDVKIQETCCGN